MVGAAAPVDDIRRLVQRRRRHPRAGGQGSDRHQGRAADDLRRAAVALSRATCRAATASACRRASRTKPSARGCKALVARAVAAPDAQAATSCAPRRRAQRPKRSREDIAYLDKLWQHVRETGAARRSPASSCYEDLPLPLRVLRDSCARGVEQRAGRFARRRMRRMLRVRARSSCRACADAHRALPARGRSSTCTASRTKSSKRARTQGAAEVRRPPGHRPDRGDDHHRRQHRRLRRAAQSRGDDLPHQPRSRAVAIARQLRLRNLGGIIIIDFIDMQRRGAPPPGAARAARRALARRSRQDAHRRASRRWAWWR